MYKTINGWTKEQMIGHYTANFKGKSFKSLSHNEKICAYRGDDGKKCNVGVFIPDEKYSSKMDIGDGGLSARKVIEIGNLGKDMPLDPEVMSEFQKIHDYTPQDEVLERSLIWIKNNVTDGVPYVGQ